VYLLLVLLLLGSKYLISYMLGGNIPMETCCSSYVTSSDWFGHETEDAHLQDILDLVFNLSFFTYFGMIIPWSEFSTIVDSSIWQLIGLAVLILLFRRIPVVFSLYWAMPVLQNWREALFVGWFGPIGVGAIFYAVLALEELRKIGYKKDEDRIHNIDEVIFPAISFIVLSSIIVHGITVPIFKLSTSKLAHNITHPTALAQVIRRLPMMHDDHEMVIHHTKHSTTITISRNNTYAPGELANPVGFNLESTVSISEDPTLQKGTAPDEASASKGKSLDASRRSSFASSINRKAKYLPAGTEGCITYVHSVDENGRLQSTLVEDSITSHPLNSESVSITIDRRPSQRAASTSNRSPFARYLPTILPRRSASQTGIRLDRPTQSLSVLERRKGANDWV
jgi:hypothetical protein